MHLHYCASAVLSVNSCPMRFALRLSIVGTATVASLLAVHTPRVGTGLSADTKHRARVWRE